MPGNQTFSYLGTNGVAYAWCIVRGATSVESASYTDGNSNAAVGTDSIVVSLTGARIAAIVASCADGVSETGETASLSNLDQQTSSGSGHAAGRYAMIGFTKSSVTSSYTTTQLELGLLGNYIVYLQ